MIFLPSVVCVGRYFNKKRGFATGIAVSGAGVGTFALSTLTSVLVQSYGWQGTMLIQAGIMLNCVALGVVYVPIKSFTSNKDRKPIATICDNDVFVHRNTSDETETLQNQDIATQPCCLNPVSNNTKQLPLVDIRQSLDADENLSDVKSRHTHVFKDIFRDILLSLKTSFDRSIFRNISFCTFLVSTFFGNLGYYIPYIYLPATGMEEGKLRSWILYTVHISACYSYRRR
jgi:MFS family permease